MHFSSISTLTKQTYDQTYSRNIKYNFNKILCGSPEAIWGSGLRTTALHYMKMQCFATFFSPL